MAEKLCTSYFIVPDGEWQRGKTPHADAHFSGKMTLRPAR